MPSEVDSRDPEGEMGVGTGVPGDEVESKPCKESSKVRETSNLTTYIIGDVVIKLLRDEVIQTQNAYAISGPY